MMFHFKMVLFLFLSLFALPKEAFALEVSWYFPWQNNLKTNSSQGLIAADVDIPVLLNGTNFRIVKIKKKKGDHLKSLEVFSEISASSIYYLPIISDYSGNRIVDVIQPLERGQSFKDDEDIYFLVKFTGNRYGEKYVNLVARTTSTSVSSAKKIVVSSVSRSTQLDLNVWAYFDYLLLKGLKKDAIKDLYEHNTSVLIIPPNKFPPVNNLNKKSISMLEQYIANTLGKFKYYAFSFGYDLSKKGIMNNKWKRDFQAWYKVIKTIMNDHGISDEHILLYPYDEPSGISVTTLLDMSSWLKKSNIKMPLYVTIGKKEAAVLASSVDIVQVSTKHVDDVKLMLKNDTKLWIYNIPGNRDTKAVFYNYMGVRAFFHGASGIGIWNYADVRRAFNENNTKLFQKGIGSWEIKSFNSKGDYSLIYRKGAIIYSSLRWEALSNGMQEYQFLQLYKKRHGDLPSKRLARDLLNNKLSAQEWEKIKLQLIR